MSDTAPVAPEATAAPEVSLDDFIKAETAPPPVEVDPSDAARVLGERGGKAAAEKRAAQTEEAEPEETEEKPEVEAKPLGKPRNDPRARMLEATRKEAEAKRRAAALENELQIERAERARLLAERQAADPKAPVERDPNARPREEDFEQYGEFVEALADWKADQKLSAFRSEQEMEQDARRIAQGMNRSLSTAAQAMQAYKAEHPDFAERIAPEVAEMKVSFARSQGEPFTTDHVIADEIVFSGAKGPALMLHLSDHPEELQRLRDLRTPMDVQLEMRMLARTLDAAPAGTAPRVSVSKAHPPVRPVTGAPVAADSAEALTEDIPLDEFIRRKKATKGLQRARG